MFCPKCGIQLEDSAKFCATCGTQTAAQVPTFAAPEAAPAPIPTPVVFEAPAAPLKKTGWKKLLIPLASVVVVGGILAILFLNLSSKNDVNDYVAKANAKTEALLKDRDTAKSVYKVLGVNDLSEFNQFSYASTDGKTQFNLQATEKAVQFDLTANGVPVNFAMTVDDDKRATFALPGLDYAIKGSAMDFINSMIIANTRTVYNTYNDYPTPSVYSSMSYIDPEAIVEPYDLPQTGDMGLMYYLMANSDTLLEPFADAKSFEDVCLILGVDKKHFDRDYTEGKTVRIPNIDTELTKYTTTIDGKEFIEIIKEIIEGDYADKIIDVVMEMQGMNGASGSPFMTPDYIKSMLITQIDRTDTSDLPTFIYTVYINDKDQAQATSLEMTDFNSGSLTITHGYNGVKNMVDSQFTSLVVDTGRDIISFTFGSSLDIDESAKTLESSIYFDVTSYGETMHLALDTKLADGVFNLGLEFAVPDSGTGSLTVNGTYEGFGDQLKLGLTDAAYFTPAGSGSIAFGDSKVTYEKADLGELKIDKPVKKVTDFTYEDWNDLGDAMTAWVKDLGIK